MECGGCKREIEPTCRYCPTCGRRYRTGKVSRGLRTAGLFLSVAVLVTWFAGILYRQYRLSTLKRGSRGGVAYVFWLAGRSPNKDLLEQVLGMPARQQVLSAGRTITWFRLSDGLLGFDPGGPFLHFRPTSPLPLQMLSSYRSHTEVVRKGPEWPLVFEGTDGLRFLVLTSQTHPEAAKELILWRSST
ncbi:MAG: hypothetical protein AB1898_08060 [Acidobacteriota bacterium]